MKKKLFLISLLLIGCSPAEPVENGTINYEFIDNGLIARVIESPSFNKKELIIPSTVIHNNKEYTVKKIKMNSFKDNKYIEKVDLPDTVNDIGYDIFRNCTSLKSVDYSLGLTTIPDHMFAGCTSLTSFINGDNVETMNKGVFRDTAIRSISFTKLKKLNINAFFNCPNLEEVSLLGSYTSLPGSFFEKCPSLKRVELPESVNTISSYAFKKCPSLEEFDFSNIKSLGTSSFESSGLKNINLKVNSIGIWCFYNCDKLENVTIDTKQISQRCFYGCDKLNEVNLLNTKIIGNEAFANSSITSITIPSSLQSISSYGFSNSKLEQINFDDNSSLEVISRYAFDNCLLQGDITLPSSLKSIYHNAFTNTKLNSVKISSLTSVDNNSFDENVTIERY